VIFDLGGVVLDSPLHAIRDFEASRGIPVGFLDRVVVDSGAQGAWARHERGEIEMEAFCRALDDECRARGHVYPATELMQAIAENSAPRPRMLAAIRTLRDAGLIVSALTNNWRSDGQDRHGLRQHFDHFLESSVLGIRKPEPEIYRLALREIGVEAEETLFLDDIGSNLKTARALGMQTIKVDEPEQALRELEDVIGLVLLD